MRQPVEKIMIKSFKLFHSTTDQVKFVETHWFLLWARFMKTKRDWSVAFAWKLENSMSKSLSRMNNIGRFKVSSPIIRWAILISFLWPNLWEPMGGVMWHTGQGLEGPPLNGQWRCWGFQKTKSTKATPSNNMKRMPQPYHTSQVLASGSLDSHYWVVPMKHCSRVSIYI